jgi:pyruvate dehydrogenase E1 component alpha subunit/2-oxoisovalerate dehydrogenase E1 component alpha subunit
MTPTNTEAFSSTGLHQVLGEDGKLLAGRKNPLSQEQLLKLYRAMVLTRVLDTRMLNMQRQGRIAFYGTITGQEGATLGSAFAMEDRDWLFPALREGAAAILRGLPLLKAVAQFIGNDLDDCRGRQMPCHPTYRERNYVSMSSCIGTQIPHAVGAAMAARIRRQDVVVLGYLGDGATSEPDFHAAINFAGVYRAPVVLFCQNNQWAISVPVSKQTASKTIAIKANAYGVEGVRVDGNDALAVYEVTKRAADKARRGDGPTFIEAVTYRLSGHTSSDDPTRYRDEAEVEAWRQKDPLRRMRLFLEGLGVWSTQRESALEAELNEEISAAIEQAEKAPPPPPGSMVEDVYSKVPWHLQEQMAEVLRAHTP